MWRLGENGWKPGRVGDREEQMGWHEVRFKCNGVSLQSFGGFRSESLLFPFGDSLTNVRSSQDCDICIAQ